jgi:hypothetical protein
MAIKPTKPTVPPAPSRSNPGVDFSNKADVFAAFQAPFADYMDDIADFVDEMADDALAAATGGDLPPLTGQAGKVLAVKGDESGAEFVDLPPDTVAALATNGLVARTGAGTAAARTLTAGTGIVVTNGDGVAGNPTVAADIATQAEAEAGTDNAKLMTPLRVAQAVDAQVVIPPAGGVTLLGTLTTTSGSSQTLSGLTLTDYKFLLLFINGVSPNGDGAYLTFAGSINHRIAGPSSNTSDEWTGSVLVDLAISRYSSSIANAGAGFSGVAGLGWAGTCALTNASTSVTINMSGRNFDAGSIRIYGVK